MQSFLALAAAYFMLQLVHLDPPATLSLLTQSVEKENLGKYLSLSRTILYTAIAAAPLAFSTIVENFGVSATIMVAVATLLSASFLRLFLKEIKNQARSPSGHGIKDLVEKLKAGLSYIKTGYREHAVIVTLVLLNIASGWLIDPYIVYYFVDTLGVSLAVVGFAFTATKFATIAFQPAAGFIVDKIGEKKSFTISFALAAALTAPFLAAPGIPWTYLLAAYSAHNIALSLVGTAYATYVGRKIPQNRIATFSGGVSSMMSILSLLTPLAAATIWNTSPTLSYAAYVCIYAALTILTLKL